jgi:Cu/Ag efflux pump CusA
MSPLLLATSGEEIAMISITGGVALVALNIIFGVIRTTAINKQREQTKREIAAYIAEGSMTPEQGERIINAGRQEVKC